MRLRFVLMLIALVTASMACLGSVAPTPTPQNLLPNDIVPCGDRLIVGLDQLSLNVSPLDPPSLSNSNQIQAHILMSDGRANPSDFNYHYEPIQVTEPSVIPLGRYSVGIDISDSVEPVYIWLFIVDNDDFTWAGEILNTALNTIASTLIGMGANAVVPGSGIVVGGVTDFAYDQIISGIKSEDVIGDIAILLTSENRWGQGTHRFITANEAVSGVFSVVRLSNCQDAADWEGRLPFANLTPVADVRITSCSSNSPRTRLSVGNLALVSVNSGRYLFLRSDPLQSSPGIRYAPGHVMRITDGPQCDDTRMYWEVVDKNGRKGWMAESEIVAETGNGMYYLRPIINGA